MFPIRQFFEKVQGIQAKEILIRSVARDVVRKNTSVEIPLESISFSSRTIILKHISQSARSAIFIKKTSILKEINEFQKTRIVEDIRY